LSDPVEVAIEHALLSRLAQFASSNSLTVAYPNADFTVPPASKTAQWLRATFLPADSITLGIEPADTNQHYGLLQIDAFQGQGIGELAPLRVAASIISYFARGTRMTSDGFTVNVWRQPFRGPMVKDDPWVFVPVRVPYLCLANPA
jgi:hypothetical protein